VPGEECWDTARPKAGRPASRCELTLGSWWTVSVGYSLGPSTAGFRKGFSERYGQQQAFELSTKDIIAQNLVAVRQDIANACGCANRAVDTVRLVAVTKYAKWEWVQALAALHQTFGESRPQQMAERQALMPKAEWHLIGQLQRNKVRLAVQHTATIHSVDSLKLLQRITLVAGELSVRPQILLQVNVSAEESKSGYTQEAVIAAWGDVVKCHDAVEIAGLMTMAPASDDPEDARPGFRALANLRDQLRSNDAAQNAGITLPELSMGMSSDFAVAIEEGSTLVRIGRRLFKGLG
jgi:pyridoxal phosphate enzyme (YggS family)